MVGLSLYATAIDSSDLADDGAGLISQRVGSTRFCTGGAVSGAKSLAAGQLIGGARTGADAWRGVGHSPTSVPGGGALAAGCALSFVVFW